ncbi:competence protein CoiA [Nocardiopsis dassonvillei]|uniref:competence protein CoiA family protein n=1 Tax=Nocardiopsis dassonvillei TaxID=2014 RepID=UPI0020A2813B|nr:competence protein CoiA family protein [Nocardiopsis dassonvillei]MCP3013065.1 competence protein CoiA [Nocardiopsis dassonvillei]
MQTAVVGGARSQEATQMPEGRQEALRYQSRYVGNSFWCGYWLGGCGKRLTTRVGQERIPHFAHIPDAVKPHRCHRQHTDGDSADHLYIVRDLRRWLSTQQGAAARKAVLTGDFEAGGTCREAVIDTVSGEGRITVHFQAPGKSAPHTPNHLTWHTRLYGSKVSGDRVVVQNRGYGLVLRLSANGSGGSRYRTEVGTLRGKRTTWVNLEKCVLTKWGLTTPDMPKAGVRKPEPVPELKPEPAPAAPPLTRLPLDVEQIIVRPRSRGTIVEKTTAPPGHSFLLPVDVEVPLQKGTREAALWFPDRVGTLKKGAPHRLVPPAWIEVDRKTDARWHLCGQGLTRLEEPDPPKREPARPPKVSVKQPDAAEYQDSQPLEKPQKKPDDQPSQPDPETLRNLLASLSDLVDRLTPEKRTAESEDFPRQLPLLALAEVGSASGSSGTHDGLVYALELLESLGERWLAVCLADVFTRRYFPASEKAERKWSAEARKRVLATMVARSEVRQQPARSDDRETARLLLRALGVLALRGQETELRSLVERACGELLDALRWQQIGWKDFVSERLGKNHHTISCGKFRDKPLVFRAVVRDDRGRAAEGQAQTKKSAITVAAQNFAKEHLLHSYDWWPPTGAAHRPEEVDAPSPTPSEVPDRHQSQALERLRSLGLPERGAERVLQGIGDKLDSLTRSDGVFQTDTCLHYAVVLGELLRTHTHAVEVFGRTTALSREEDRAPDLLEKRTWHAMVRECFGEGLSAGNLRQRKSLLTARLVGSWVETGRQGRMEVVNVVAESSKPVPLRPDEPSREYPGTRTTTETDFSQLCAMLGLTYSVKATRMSGTPQNWQTCLLLRHPVLGEAEGPRVHGASSTDVDSAITGVTEILDRIGEPVEWDLTPDQIPPARLLLSLQFGVVPLTSGQERADCLEQGHLGAGLLRTGNTEGFRVWARQAEQLCGEPDERRLGALAAYYGEAARKEEAATPRALSRVCARLALGLDQAAMTPESKVLSNDMGELVEGLVQVARILRSIKEMKAYSGVLDVAQRLPGVSETWVRFGPPARPSGYGKPEVTIALREAQGLAFLVWALGRSEDGRPAGIDIRQEPGGTRVTMTRVPDRFRAPSRAMIDMVLDLVPSLRLDVSASKRIAKVAPGFLRGGLAQLGVDAWQVSGYPVAQMGWLANRLERLLAWKAGAYRTRVPFDSEGWREVRNVLAEIT